MADSVLNIIKITGILNRYAWQNHELTPEELFQLLAGRRRVIEANRDRIAEMDDHIKALASRPEKEKKEGDPTEDTYKKIRESEDSLILQKYSEAWRFPVSVSDILGLMKQELGEDITKETVANGLDSLAYSPALATQEYRIKAVSATALKTWGVVEEQVARETAQGWADMLNAVLAAIKSLREKAIKSLREKAESELGAETEEAAYLQKVAKFVTRWDAELAAVQTALKGKTGKAVQKPGKSDKTLLPSNVDSVVKLNAYLDQITENEIRREETKRALSKLRNKGEISDEVSSAFDTLLSDTLSYAQELENQHFQDRIKTFKVLNDAAFAYYLDQKFLKNKSLYRKNDALNEAVRAGFAGEDKMTGTVIKQLYTFNFVKNLLHIARDNGIDLSECFLPAETPDRKAFKEILQQAPQPETEEEIKNFANETIEEFKKHLQEILPDVVEIAQTFAEKSAWVHVCFLLQKLLTAWMKCMYRAHYYAFYGPEMDLQKKQYLYYLIRGSELLEDKDRLLLLQAVETGIPDQRVKQRIQYFLQKDLSITVQEKVGVRYSNQMQDENMKRTEQGGDLSEINEKVWTAIKNKHKLLFEYCYINADGELETKMIKPKYSKKPPRPKKYEAFPFGVVYQDGYFYVLAFFDSGNTAKVMPYTFRMDLMQNVEIKEYSGRRRQINEIVSFEKETVFDEQKYKKKHPHMYGDEKKNRKERDGGILTGDEGDDGTIIFRVHKDYVRYFTYAFGENCKILKAEEGRASEVQNVRIQLDTSLGEAKIFALQYLPYCKVLSPGDLVKELKECFRGVAKEYGINLEENKSKTVTKEPTQMI